MKEKVTLNKKEQMRLMVLNKVLARVCTVSMETMKIIGEMNSISNDIVLSNQVAPTKPSK